ncbi:MAG TPA: hypothetical protein VGG65_02275 [Thermoanaerobaculia bacterium]|jgi:hypothetical protein
MIPRSFAAIRRDDALGFGAVAQHGMAAAHNAASNTRPADLRSVISLGLCSFDYVIIIR